MYFNTSTYKANGGIKCQQNDEVIMNVTSITYEYNNSPCHFTCPQSTTRSYLDGTNSICRNENIIRSLCSARQSCDLRELSSPEMSCGRASAMTIIYGCIKTGMCKLIFYIRCSKLKNVFNV